MANEPLITLVGNLTADPDLRFIPNGTAVANFTVASTPRVKDGENWTDGEPLFVRCAAWRKLGENVAESLRQGNAVIVQGRLTTRSYEHNGEKRSSLELDVANIGPDLTYQTTQVEKARRGAPGGGGAPQQTQQRQPQVDPWATPAPTDEPPF